MAAGPTLRVPTKERPTFWNKNAAVGFAFGNIPGLIIGGIIGKNRMERELKDGKLVSPPSFWNKNAAIGMAVGALVGSIAVWAIILSAPFTVAALTSAAVTASAAYVGSSLLGTILGGAHGKSRQAKEYANAKTYVAQQGEFNPYRSQELALAPKPQRATTVTPEEAALLEARLNNPDRSFAKDAGTRAQAARFANNQI